MCCVVYGLCQNNWLNRHERNNIHNIIYENNKKTIIVAKQNEKYVRKMCWEFCATFIKTNKPNTYLLMGGSGIHTYVKIHGRVVRCRKLKWFQSVCAFDRQSSTACYPQRSVAISMIFRIFTEYDARKSPNGWRFIIFW